MGRVRSTGGQKEEKMQKIVMVPIEDVRRGDYVVFQGQVRRVVEVFTRWNGYTRIVCEGISWPLLEGYAGRDKVEKVVEEGVRK